MKINFKSNSPALSIPSRGRREIGELNDFHGVTVCAVPENRNVLLLGSCDGEEKVGKQKKSHTCVTLSYRDVANILRELRERGIEL